MDRPFWRGAPPPQSRLPLLSPTEFSRTFEAERVRTERTGSVFAVVTVNLRHKRAGEFERAVEALQATMRLYDSIGELGAQTVAALLPETDPDGAHAFGDRLLLALGQANISADLSVYSYPIDWEDEDLDDEGPNAGQGPHTRPRLPRAGSHGIFALCKDSGAEGDLEPFMTQSLSPLRRAVDIAVASSVLLVGSVTILPLASLAILLDSPKGGVFFKQKRMGLGGREFDFWKFRSMRPNAEAVRAELEDDNEQSGPVFKIRNDPRMTRVGRFLRKTSLDESPQFWNILKGDMTLVGPRPPIPAEVAKYEPWQRRRLDVVPGLTCLWQVGGRSDIGFLDWMRMDLRYIRRRTAKLDLWILWRTPLAVILGRGAY